MEYKTIVTQDDLDNLLKNTHYLEDAIIKEIAVLNNAYVDYEYGLYGYSPDNTANVKILIQTQWKDSPVVELICKGVETIAFEVARDLGVYGKVEEQKVLLFFDESQKPTNCIVAKTVEYRFLDESYLGDRAFLTKNDI